jgi:hypothetical protein
VGNWRTVGVRLSEEQLALLNQKLSQLGYSTLGQLVGGLTEGVITNKWSKSLPTPLQSGLLTKC